MFVWLNSTNSLYIRISPFAQASQKTIGEIYVQIFNAVDGFCDCEAPDRVPYFNSLTDMLDAFNSVAANCGARDSCMPATKHLSNRLRQATPMLTTRKRRYDASTLLFFASNIRCPGSSACTRRSIDVTAIRLGIHVWASLRPSGAFCEEGAKCWFLLMVSMTWPLSYMRRQLRPRFASRE